MVENASGGGRIISWGPRADINNSRFVQSHNYSCGALDYKVLGVERPNMSLHHVFSSGFPQPSSVDQGGFARHPLPVVDFPRRGPGKHLGPGGLIGSTWVLSSLYQVQWPLEWVDFRNKKGKAYQCPGAYTIDFPNQTSPWSYVVWETVKLSSWHNKCGKVILI